MTIKICTQAFDPWQEIQDFQNAAVSLNGKYGATSIFIGTMRDFNDCNEIKAMLIEHYPGMTEKQLENIVASAKQQWQILDALVIHRVGKILPNEPIVIVAVWTARRDNAFDANRFIVEALKSEAPFWKKEWLTTDEQRWVTHNT